MKKSQKSALLWGGNDPDNVCEFCLPAADWGK